MRPIDTIIIHCSATPPDMDIGAKEIRHWHMAGNGWRDIGYHSVIRRDGTAEPGRDPDTPGAHCVGHNARSIGICLVGGVGPEGSPHNNYTPPQWASLARMVGDLMRRFPGARVAGHNEFAAKACPCFDVPEWWAGESKRV